MNYFIKKLTLENGKIQLTMSISFISSKDFDETRNMHTKSNTIEIMVRSETDEIIEEPFNFICKDFFFLFLALFSVGLIYSYSKITNKYQLKQKI